MNTLSETLEFLSCSPQATEDFGASLSRRLQRGDLLLLIGELGSGKTTLVRGLAAGLNVEGDVISPTFQLVRQYPGALPLAHLDLYRLQSPAPGNGVGEGVDSELGLDELLDAGVVVVEWGEPLEREDAIRVYIEEVGEDCRRILVKGLRAE